MSPYNLKKKYQRSGTNELFIMRFFLISLYAVYALKNGRDATRDWVWMFFCVKAAKRSRTYYPIKNLQNVSPHIFTAYTASQPGTSIWIWSVLFFCTARVYTALHEGKCCLLLFFDVLFFWRDVADHQLLGSSEVSVLKIEIIKDNFINDLLMCLILCVRNFSLIFRFIC